MDPYYDAAGQRLFCGRWEDVLPTLEPGYDLIFTSPPYNLGTSTGGGIRNVGRSRMWTGREKGKGPWASARGIAEGYDSHDDAMPFPEYVAWQHAFLRACWRLLGTGGAIFYNHKPRVQALRLVHPVEYVPAELLAYRRQDVTLRRNGGVNFAPTHYLPSTETIIILARPEWRLAEGGWNATDVWDMPTPKESRHPAPFHVSLPLRAITTTGAKRVLDPHVGSGTTLLASQMAGIHGDGVEPSAEYCAEAVRRLSQIAMLLEVA